MKKMPHPGLVDRWHVQKRFNFDREHIIHLVRLRCLSCFTLLLLGLMVGIYLYQYTVDIKSVQVVWQQGALFYSSDSQKWDLVDGDHYPDNTFFYVGNLEKKEDDASPYAVLQYGKHYTVVANAGAKVSYQKRPDGKVGFSVKGTAFFYIASKDQEPLEFFLNERRVVTQAAELQSVYYKNGQDDSQEKIQVASGELSISPGSPPQDQEPFRKENMLFLSKNEYLSIQGEVLKIGTFNPQTDPIYASNYVPGFEAVDKLRPIGVITPYKNRFTLIRNRKNYSHIQRAIPFSIGDQITTGDNSNAMVSFFTGDRIKLYASSVFRDEALSEPQWSIQTIYKQLKGIYLASTLPITPENRIILGSKVKSKGDKRHLTFNFSGTVRAGINPKIKKRRVRFKTAGAMVSVRGTEFKVRSDGEHLQAMTLNGIVALKSISHSKVVEVRDLEFSQIQKNKAPHRVRELTTKEIQELLNDVFLDENNNPIYITRSELETYQTELMQKIFCGAYNADLENKDDATIRAFQKKMKIRVDGIVGPETRGKLKEILQCDKYNKGKLGV